VLDRTAAREALLPVVQSAAFVAGRSTSGLRMLPGLLICGAQRCGTTSMYQALRQHPAVLRPVGRKGVHYFDDVTYLNGPAWYRAHFPLTVVGRRLQRRTGERAVAFESSPYYLFHPCAATRIARDLPQVRVLILVRDPVERAYSAYTHEAARGYETERFERALELEPVRLAGEEEKLRVDDSYASHAHRHQAYVARGRYIDQIERMTAALGRDRVHVVDAEDFFTQPEPVWDEVRNFVGLSPADPVFEQHNARPRSSMADSLRTTLRAQFEDSDARLARWWGREPSWRR
jgi:sulfotransferase family protein